MKKLNYNFIQPPYFLNKNETHHWLSMEENGTLLTSRRVKCKFFGFSEYKWLKKDLLKKIDGLLMPSQSLFF